jgi:hypothetical protein
MSFIPAVSDFSNTFPPTPAGTLPVQIGAMNNNLPDKGILIVRQTNHVAACKLVKRQLPRARKARARLRQQHKLRTAAPRTN